MESKPTRKSNRLQDYDYSQNGAYFVTICTKNRCHLFWNETNGINTVSLSGNVPLNKKGSIVEQAILDIERHYAGITVTKYVVMPNHVHIVLMFEQYDMRGMPIAGGRSMIAPTGAVRPTTLPNIIKHLKGVVTKALGEAIWQKGYHDHIIRNDEDFKRIWQYIDENPLKWELDEYYITP